MIPIAELIKTTSKSNASKTLTIIRSFIWLYTRGNQLTSLKYPELHVNKPSNYLLLNHQY